MKTALEVAGFKRKYTPTRHTIDRARLRFGIPSESVADWINGLMSEAKYVAANGKRSIYEAGDIQIIVDSTTQAVITVHHALRTDFLRPALEREIRKIRREYTRKIRATERKLAGQYRRLGEQFVNFSNARNPQTRALIGERIEQTENIIEGVKQGIERMKDDMQAKIKAIELIAE